MREKTPAGAENAERGAVVEDRLHSTAPTPPIEPLLAIKDVLIVLGRKRRWLEGKRSSGAFPKPDAYAGAGPRWRRSTLSRWISEGGTNR